MNCISLIREFFMAALIVLLAFVICLPTVVEADDLSPVEQPAENVPPLPPVDSPGSKPPAEEWVPWPIEEPGFIRVIKEPLGSVDFKIKHETRSGAEDGSSEDTPAITYNHIKPVFAALLLNDRSSTAAYNSLVSTGLTNKEISVVNIFFPAE